MSLSQSRGDRHVLLHYADALLDDSTIELIQTRVFNLWENQPENIVLDFTNLTEDNSSKFGFLKDLSDHARERGCSFVIATTNPALQAFSDDQQISYAPTQAEAVDLAFIETLERGFNEEED